MEKVKSKITIKISKATIKDISLIIDIQKRDGFKHAYYLTPKRLKGLFNRGEIFYIAYLKNEAVAFVALDIEKRVKLHFLSVAEEQRKKGIGTFLMQKIINETKKYKKTIIYAYVEEKSPLEKFLIRNKFKKAGYFLNRFGKGRDANILSFSL